MPHALVVEDEADAADMLATLIAGEGFSVATAGSLREARQQLALQEPDVVLLDLMLPDGSGMQLFDDDQALVNAEVVLMTGHASLETSIQALRLGAADYLIKPVNLKQLSGVLSRAIKPSALKAEACTLLEELEREGHFGLLWGRAPSMRSVYEQIIRVSATSVTILITGESGCGKEVVANTVHELSRRRHKPFIAVNCGAISPQLFESELFGHEKGSFTGAERQHQGIFERASGGTLFLDEITEMPMDLQVKLLRVLETNRFMRVGSTQAIEVDVRIMAATNQSPEQAVKLGRFREDLLYRLNVFPIHLPPLRERMEDVPLIANHFLEDISRREGHVKQYEPQALARLNAYTWPGNVRELRNIVHRAYVMAAGSTILDECLPRPDEAPSVVSGGPTLHLDIGMPLSEIERQVILSTLDHLGRNKERTAATLGISLKTLYNRLKEYATVPSRLDL